MAGLANRIYIASGIILVAGIGINFLGKAKASGYDEAFMEKSAPMKVADFTFQGSQDSPGKSYTADDRTYELLKPFGIVPRHYDNGTQRFEVLLISSNTKESFHDQKVCFPGQGMTPTGEKVYDLEVEGRGTIPVVVATYQTDSNEQVISAYFYRGPGGYHKYPQQLARAMLMNAVFGARQSNNSTYYRFMPQYRGATVEDTLAFIKAYMPAAEKSSKGFY